VKRRSPPPNSGTREHFDGRDPKSIPAPELSPGHDKARKPSIGAQRCTILAVRDENLLSVEPRVNLSLCKHYLVAVCPCDLDVPELPRLVSLLMPALFSESHKRTPWSEPLHGPVLVRNVTFSIECGNAPRLDGVGLLGADGAGGAAPARGDAGHRGAAAHGDRGRGSGAGEGGEISTLRLGGPQYRRGFGRRSGGGGFWITDRPRSGSRTAPAHGEARRRLSGSSRRPRCVRKHPTSATGYG
jgi:hypothetical protein